MASNWLSGRQAVTGNANGFPDQNLATVDDADPP